MLTLFRHLISHSLIYSGDASLLGVTHDGWIYAEELYGHDDWLAQHRLTRTGGIVESVDESSGANLDMKPLSLPDDIITPDHKSCCEALHFSGARLRGLLSEERIDEIVLPLSVADKIELVDYMEWDIDPMQLIGIAESVVLAHTRLPDETLIVCRRVRVAYRLVEPHADYDYDALAVYLLHEVYPDDDVLDLVDCLNDDDDVVLLRPMDCLFYGGLLYVADGGEDEDKSAIHIFEYDEGE